MATLVLAIIFLCVVILLTEIYKFYTNSMSKIPSPPGLPVIGNLLHFLSDPDKIFYKTRYFSSKYYPIYRLSCFNFNVVVLLDPNDIELVLSSTKHLRKSRVYGYLKEWLGTGLLTSAGAKWHYRRKILTPAFHFDILQQFVIIFNDEAEKLVEKLEQHCGKESINVVPFITNFTLQSIGETAMGFKNVTEESYMNYKKAVYEMGNIILNRISKPWFHLQALYKLSSLAKEEKIAVETLRTFTNNIILQREKEGEEKEKRIYDYTYKKKNRLAMLDLLLAAKKEGADIDFDGIREEVDTFMFEGHDTTSMAISFILLTLANQKEAQNKIFEEIIEVLGPNKAPTLQDLQTLKYTERCIKECLRLFPSVPFISRRAGEDFRTSTGFLIPKNTIVHIHIFDIHRNPNIYPDPLKFDPNRFLPTNVNSRHPFAYIPFSAGPRNCIGQRFAIFELKAALCGILRKFILEPVDDMFQIKFKPDLVLRPKDKIKIKIVPRIY